MGANFDKAAKNYDQTFTNSEIGRMQRSLVYNELSQQLLFKTYWKSIVAPEKMPFGWLNNISMLLRLIFHLT